MFNVVEEIWYESLRVQPYSQGFIMGCLTLLISLYFIGYFLPFDLFQLRFMRNRNMNSIASFDKQTQNPSGNTNTLDQRLKEIENQLTSLMKEDEQLKVTRLTHDFHPFFENKQIFSPNLFKGIGCSSFYGWTRSKQDRSSDSDKPCLATFLAVLDAIQPDKGCTTRGCYL